MPSPRRARALLGAALVLSSLAGAGCGLEAKPVDRNTKPGDPVPAERALKLYLDEDRCDVISPHYLQSIDPDPKRALALCEKGQIPPDALVKPGEYTMKDAEVIDGNGIVRVVLEDGGIRDYTLTPGGPEQFQVDQLVATTKAEYGDPLRLQARESPTAEAVDAVITVKSLRRVLEKDLSQDEYASSMNHYYLLRVKIESRSEKEQLLGTDGFQLATKEGYPIATPQEMYTDLGRPLPGVLRPGDTNVGDVFFAVPEQVSPKMVKFVYGDQFVGDTLSWTPRKK